MSAEGGSRGDVHDPPDRGATLRPGRHGRKRTGPEAGFARPHDLALNEVGHANPDEGYARTLRRPATKQRATASTGSGLHTTNDGSRGQNNTEPAVITVRGTPRAAAQQATLSVIHPLRRSRRRRCPAFCRTGFASPHTVLLADHGEHREVSLAATSDPELPLCCRSGDQVSATVQAAMAAAPAADRGSQPPV
jgi:hypothetical protein